MPRGTNLTLASGTGNLTKTLTGGDRATLLILNPNDGIVYVTINAQASPAVWDFIVPSQSRAYLPGPWLTYGLYFLDQSGAGHSGNITIFESDTQLLLPDYGSIGRALQAQVTTVDVVEGAQPGNPAVGIARLWVDNNGRLNVLLSNGATEPVIYQGDVAGGVLNGTYPNPGLAASSVGTSQLSPLFSVIFARLAASVALPLNTVTTVLSVTVTPGLYIVLAQVTLSSATTGVAEVRLQDAPQGGLEGSSGQSISGGYATVSLVGLFPGNGGAYAANSTLSLTVYPTVAMTALSNGPNTAPQAATQLTLVRIG